MTGLQVAVRSQLAKQQKELLRPGCILALMLMDLFNIPLKCVLNVHEHRTCA